MQKPGKSGRTRGLVDMSIAPPEFEYKRPALAEKMIDNHIVLYPEGICQLHVVAWTYRGKCVDFSFTQMAGEIDTPKEGEDHVARYDCCHSEVHKHQYYRNGHHYKTGEDQQRTVIARIDTQETSWDVVDSSYDVCYDEMVDHWEANYRRWNSDGQQQ